MMLRMYLMRLKCLFRNKQSLFWSALFPIFLSFVFSIVFANLDSDEKFTTIDIAIVANEQQSYIADYAKDAKISDDTNLFHIDNLTFEEAKESLKKGNIVGFIVDGERPELYLGGSSIEGTILKTFVDNYLQKVKEVGVLASIDPDLVHQIMNESIENVDYINDRNVNGKAPKWSLIYFYALLALACSYGSNFGVTEISDIQADKSAKGARINVAPVHKMKLLICNLCAAITVQVLCILVAIAFMAFVINVDFGDRAAYVVLTCVLGSICGVAFGAMLRAVIKKNEKTVSAISNAVVLLLSFLSGLMNPEVKYMVAENVPFFSKINPANLITDSLYYLYYFDSLNRFWFNTVCMIVVTVVFGAITYFATRRRQYASI